METGKNRGLTTAATSDVWLLWSSQTLPPKFTSSTWASAKIPFLYSFQCDKLVCRQMADSLEKSKIPSDKGDSKEIRLKLPDLLNASALLGFAGVLAFSTSYLYVHCLSCELQLERGDLARYFDIRDYIQITPVGGTSFLAVFVICLCFLVSGIRKFYLVLTRRALLPAIFGFAVLLLFPFFIAKSEANRIMGRKPCAVIPVVTLKSDHSTIPGNVIFSLNRYLLIYGKRYSPIDGEEWSVIAIPQTEIQMIMIGTAAAK